MICRRYVLGPVFLSRFPVFERRYYRRFLRRQITIITVLPPPLSAGRMFNLTATTSLLIAKRIYVYIYIYTIILLLYISIYYSINTFPYSILL